MHEFSLPRINLRDALYYVAYPLEALTTAYGYERTVL